MDAKVTGAFDKWEPTTLDVDIKPFPLRNRTKFVPGRWEKRPGPGDEVETELLALY